MTNDTADADLEGLLARALATRGELIPSTVEEVLDAQVDDVELPASLEDLRESPALAPARTLQGASRVRPLRALVYAGVLAAGVAAIWALFAVRPRPEPISGDATKTPSTRPAGPSGTAAEAPIVVSHPVCSGECCAGADCTAARGELATCPTERTCIPCSALDDPATLYRLRVGDLFAEGAAARDVDRLDLCFKVGAAPSAEWSCEPARAPASARPHGRFLKTASSSADLAGGVAMELRMDGKAVRGRWWSILKPTPKTLCLGYKVGFEDDRREPVGTVSMFLERTYYVELARRDHREELEQLARSFSFQSVVPRYITSGPRKVLALGPFDREEANQTLANLKKTAPPTLLDGARIDPGDGYDSW